MSGQSDDPVVERGRALSRKLRDMAKNKGWDPEATVKRYALERLLYRLQLAGHSEHFDLKGAFSVMLWTDGSFHRPTEDIDLNGATPLDTSFEGVVGMIQDAAEVQVGEDDGLAFCSDSISIRKQREGIIQGGKVRLAAHLGDTRVRMEVDIGFGNPITPDPESQPLDTLLDLPAPSYDIYPLETTIAEKLNPILHWGMDNTRVKDIYDIWFISQSWDGFDGETLVKAISETLSHQKTEIPEGVPEGLSPEFAADKERAWSRFIGAKKLDAPEIDEALEQVRQFIMPVLAACRGEADVPGTWEPGEEWAPAHMPTP